MRLVSVLTPCYNHAKFLPDFFGSLISQTYERIELIMLDDCSSDHSYEIMEAWRNRLEARCERVVMMRHAENQGITKSCNELLANACGEYIKLIASDDILFPKALQCYADYLDEHPSDGLVYSDGCFIPSDRTLSKNNPHVGKSGDIFRDLLLYGCFVPAPSLCYRRSCTENHGCYDEELPWEDYEFLLRLTKRERIGYLDKKLVGYRLSENSASRSTQSAEKAREKILLMERVNFRAIEKNTNEQPNKFLKRVRLRQYVRLLSYALSMEDPVLIKRYREKTGFFPLLRESPKVFAKLLIN